jgi:hypothetical protein
VALLEREGEVAADFLERLLDIADLDGDIEVDIDGDRAAVSIVDSEEGRVPRRLVGPDGKVLDALQELTRLAVRATGERSRLMLDAAGFWADRRTALAQRRSPGARLSARAWDMSAFGKGRPGDGRRRSRNPRAERTGIVTSRRDRGYPVLPLSAAQVFAPVAGQGLRRSARGRGMPRPIGPRSPRLGDRHVCAAIQEPAPGMLCADIASWRAAWSGVIVGRTSRCSGRAPAANGGCAERWVCRACIAWPTVTACSMWMSPQPEPWPS